MKKIIAVIISGVLLFSFTSSAFAISQENNYKQKYKVDILQDNDEKIAKSEDEINIYKTIYNKKNNTVQLLVINKITDEIKFGDKVQINSLTNSNAIQTRASLNENTFTNYEYTKKYGRPNKWQIRRPDKTIFSWYYFDTTENNSNRNYLNNFKNSVDKINDQEVKIALSLGASALSYLAVAASGAGAIFSGGTLTPAAWASILAAAGLTTNHINLCLEYDRYCKEAYDNYWQVVYNS